MPSIKKRFTNICKEYGLVGASLEIYKNNKSKSLFYGKASEKSKTTKKTIYRIASVSKVIVALAAMKLVEEHKLNLDRDISDYLGFKVRNIHYPDDIITTRMLMTQTSSLTDGFDDEDLTNETRRDGYNGVNGTFLDVSLKDLLIPNDSIYYSELTFSKNKPGTTFIYSNFGCGILACIVEKITNEYFTDYVKKVLFNPLGINASFRCNELAHSDKIASTYISQNNEMILNRTKEYFLKGVYPRFPIGENFRGPAGGLFISNQDLSKIMKMMIYKGLYNGKQVYKSSTIEKMFEKNWEGEFEEYRAKGLQMIMLEDFYNHLVYGHFGNAYGVRSFMLFDKDEQMGMCFITNGVLDKTETNGILNMHLKMFELLVKDE